MKLVNDEGHEFHLDDVDMLILLYALDAYIETLGERGETIGYHSAMDRALGLHEWIREDAP